ncbi:XVIPCD domain-containing protein [uncultured Neisseria sp.]|uniref:XVIPCD domain-containing protein n=1 Tax=uncultured Neisseria sp. TaxID=237778 RepID=UPI0026266BA0|nr:XVIPCD domain-containing protein [uncultured Neisseria sp.]
MSQLTKQQYADLAADAYENRVVTPPNKTLVVGGNHYKVLAVHNNPKTDYQGAVYQDVRTNEIIVAHRGTESMIDAKVDLKMVLDRVNIQAEDAAKLTRMALREADDFSKNNQNQLRPKITQVGHSLGGALAQIQSYRFNHEGVTFNAYGAAALKDIPEGGNRVVNYARASDAVSAAAPHYGKVIILAKQSELTSLWTQGYNNSINMPPVNTAASALVNLGAHSISNFTGSDSILSERNYQPALELAQRNRTMIEDYREDVKFIRSGIHKTNEYLKDTREIYRKTREIIDKDPNMMSWNERDEPYRHTQLSFSPELQSLHEKARTLLVECNQREGICQSETEFDNTAAYLTTAMQKAKMTDVDGIGRMDGKLHAIHDTEELDVAIVDPQTAARTPVADSVVQSQQMAQQFEYEEQQRQYAQSQSRGMMIS